MLLHAHVLPQPLHGHPSDSHGVAHHHPRNWYEVLGGDGEDLQPYKHGHGDATPEENGGYCDICAVWDPFCPFSGRVTRDAYLGREGGWYGEEGVLGLWY